MKKILALLLAVVMVFGLVACGGSDDAEETTGSTAEVTVDMKVAMVSDYADITDGSFNQTTHEAAKAWCDAKGVEYTYFKPVTDSDADRVAMIEMAISEGYNVLLLPGYAFAPAIKETADLYPDVSFVALDVSEGDLGDYTLPENAFSAVYQEELSGYMAGYAAVKLGYKHLGFLGGMAVPAVMRFGYGYLQGIDAAATELGISDEIVVEYCYGNQFWGDADITAAMDTWYQEKGVELVFACGGSIYTSAAEAAAKVDGKVIGVDSDQAAIIDGVYGEGMTVTSAMKSLDVTVETMLSEIAAGNFGNYGGQVVTFGLASATPAENYVQLPETTQFAEGFTAEDYAALVAAMYNGEIVVSNATDAMPEVSYEVNDYGNLK